MWTKWEEGYPVSKMRLRKWIDHSMKENIKCIKTEEWITQEVCSPVKRQSSQIIAIQEGEKETQVKDLSNISNKIMEVISPNQRKVMPIKA